MDLMVAIIHKLATSQKQVTLIIIIIITFIIVIIIVTIIMILCIEYTISRNRPSLLSLMYPFFKRWWQDIEVYRCLTTIQCVQSRARALPQWGGDRILVIYRKEMIDVGCGIGMLVNLNGTNFTAESELEQGGYFIVNGSEKVIIAPQQHACNNYLCQWLILNF